MIARMGRTRFIMCALLILVLCAAVIFAAFGIKLPEASGKTVKKDGKMTIDCSNMSEGYIMVKAKKTNKRLKLQIATEGAKLNYDLNSDGEFEVFPLQFGSGKYQVSLYENAGGKKYSKEGSVKLNVNIPDKLSCFLYPNQYVNYTKNSACVKESAEICKGLETDKEKVDAIRKYVVKNFQYDYIKSVTVAGSSGMLPDIEGCWKSKKGICQDLSAMAVAMMRAQGIHATLVIGTLGSGTPHAWVMVYLDGEEIFFDPTAELNASNKSDSYSALRWY